MQVSHIQRFVMNDACVLLSIPDAFSLIISAYKQDILFDVI